jgi:hypothetical protein
VSSPAAPPTTTWAVAAPPRIAAWIRDAPDSPVPVVHRARSAVYFDVAGRCVGLTHPGAVRLPISLRTNAPGGSSHGAASAYVEGGVLHWGGHALVTGRLVGVRAPRLDLHRTPDKEAGPAAAPDFPQSRVAGPVASTDVPSPVLPTRVDARSVADLVGRGDGLTPLGDDVVCGWLACHRAAGIPTDDVDAAVRRLLPRTTFLSSALLEAALLGEVCAPVADYLLALGTTDAAPARTRLTRVGHTSGTGLAHGIDLGLADLLRMRDAA